MELVSAVAMLSSITALHMLFLPMKLIATANEQGFIFNEFMKFGGMAGVSPNGLITLVNNRRQSIGQAFYNIPFQFKNSSAATREALSFSTTFAFAIVPEYRDVWGHGMAFVLAPSNGLPHALPSQYLGLFNKTNMGDPSNHVVAIELDTIDSSEFRDINNNHVGIDINSLVSAQSAPAGYFADNNGEFRDLTLISGDRMLVWVDYDGLGKQLDVTLAPIEIPKPRRPLLSLDIDLSPVILDNMYIGFSSSSGSVVGYSYVLGWSFQLNGKAKALDISRLPSIPNSAVRKAKRRLSKGVAIGLSAIAVLVFLLVTVLGILFKLRKREKPEEEVLENWEVQYGPHRFAYKELFIATKGFSDKELLGKGGFGRVYSGVLSSTKTQVAVKRVSHESSQGMKEFIAEIATIGRLRHPNLVRLLGYSRCKGELLLVYDFMPNASLDKFLFSKANNPTLNWSQRFKVIKDVGTGLAYLHAEWMQVIVHRDIKASNVLLDSEFNGRLGDFGLARLSNHGMDPKTTHLAGTLGYIAPELSRTGKATTATDVFAFGAFMLEVACGRRPIEPQELPEKIILVDWASECWKNGDILKIVDPKLQKDYVIEEMELVLKLGLICSHPTGRARPRMSQVMEYLRGNAPLPDNLDLDANSLVQELEVLEAGDATQDSELKNDSRPSITITEPFIATGR